MGGTFGAGEGFAGTVGGIFCCGDEGGGGETTVVDTFGCTGDLGFKSAKTSDAD